MKVQLEDAFYIIFIFVSMGGYFSLQQLDNTFGSSDSSLPI